MYVCLLLFSWNRHLMLKMQKRMVASKSAIKGTSSRINVVILAAEQKMFNGRN